VYRIVFGRARSEWPKWTHEHDATDVLILSANDVYGAYAQGFLRWANSLAIAVGNRNGDRYQDLLVTAGYENRPDGGPAGAAYLLAGRPRSEWPAFIDLRDGADLIVYGADYPPSPGYQLDNMGYACGMADFDDDGRDEVFLTAPFGDGPANTIPDCGEAYIIYSEAPVTSRASSDAPSRSALLPNYPNPFTDSTRLQFHTTAGDQVELSVYDAAGRRVATPVHLHAALGDGETVSWNGTNDTGVRLPSGVYFVKLKAGAETTSRKVLIVR
jgi:hypothetical protein